MKAQFADRASVIRVFMMAVALALSLGQVARAATVKIVERQVTLVDETRGIKPSMGFAGSETRRIDVMVWYPKRQNGPLPLVIYSHGTFGFAANAMHLVKALVDAGYVVAAPDYPLSSRNAYTGIQFADVSDVAEQVRDVSFIIGALTADPELGRRIDGDRIGTTGHSLGAVTSYFASFGARTRDPRIKATAPIAGGDPVEAALDTPMGMEGVGRSKASVPVLFLTAEHDVFSDLTGAPYVAYTRVAPPKYEIMVKGGVHVWFRDGGETLSDGKNPDCLFFERRMPDMDLPMCAERPPLIAPQRQQAITRGAIIAFFDAYLKGDGVALERLDSIGNQYPEATVISER